MLLIDVEGARPELMTRLRLMRGRDGEVVLEGITERLVVRIGLSGHAPSWLDARGLELSAAGLRSKLGSRRRLVGLEPGERSCGLLTEPELVARRSRPIKARRVARYGWPDTDCVLAFARGEPVDLGLMRDVLGIHDDHAQPSGDRPIVVRGSRFEAALLREGKKLSDWGRGPDPGWEVSKI